MYNILKLNDISKKINDILTDDFNVSKDVKNPEGILLRSFNMHEYPIENNLLAVARCGAGTNNIPVSKMTEKGIIVFNTPGANANAVKELVILAMLLGSRKIVDSIEWVKSLKGNGNEVGKMVESGKKAFIGPELEGKTLGVIGLGAIGSMVANTAINLHMDVYGYDPFINVDVAWGLSRKVKHALQIETIFAECDYITMHVPLTDLTRNLVNKESIAKMKDNVVIINCARGELVNNADMIEAVQNKKVARYITDFPCEEVIGIDNIIAIPHLGASTPEAEDNCAVMAARELKDFLENGNIVNSVNFPTVTAPRTGKMRITIIHKNISGMISKATSFFSEKGINIANIESKSKNDTAYMIMDIDTNISDEEIAELSKIEGFIRVRVIK